MRPLRRAAGAREQPFISPRSGTNTRSRDCQVWPLSPSPSRNRASEVTRRNSSVTDPASWTNRRAWSSGCTAQNDPYDQPNASRTLESAAVITSPVLRHRPRASSNWLTARTSAPVSASRFCVSIFSVTTSHVIIAPMYLPASSFIGADEQLEELGADVDRPRARQIARVRQDSLLMLGHLVEDVDRAADHLVDLDRQVTLRAA